VREGVRIPMSVPSQMTNPVVFSPSTSAVTVVLSKSSPSASKIRLGGEGWRVRARRRARFRRHSSSVPESRLAV
jgi:hypothetical protein